jgi:hypothetical protein
MKTMISPARITCRRGLSGGTAPPAATPVAGDGAGLSAVDFQPERDHRLQREFVAGAVVAAVIGPP